MKCPECVKSNKRSTVQVGVSMTTAMWSAPFYDEDGLYHYHDPNTTTTNYSCSRGHHWQGSLSGECWCEREKERKREKANK